MYNDWLGNIANRFQNKFDSIQTEHNFEYGPEFEIAICEVLKTILPRRAEVCRGYVVSQNGDKAGDDIIVFDAARFPVLRALGDDLSRKEQVPAEAVLAYIEAKHTLYVYGDSAQSLAKATAQTGAIKALTRTPLEHRHMIKDLDLGATVVSPPSFPEIKNPWYTAIWSRYSKWSGEEHIITPEALNAKDANLAPDLVATNEGCLMPGLVSRVDSVANEMEIRPFLCSKTEHIWCDIKNVGLGIAAIHLLWAIEWIVLSEIPWNPMMSNYLRTANLTCWDTHS